MSAAGTGRLWGQSLRALQMPFSSEGGVYHTPEEGVYTGPAEIDAGNAGDGNSSEFGSSGGDVDGFSIFSYTGGVVGMILVVAVLMYVISIVAERCCGCFQRHNDPPAPLDRGPVARKANLTGLTKDERSMLIKHIFSNASFSWNKTPSTAGHEHSQVDEEMVERDIENADTDDIILKSRNEGADTDDEVGENEADHERICCVCLVEYESGCNVLTGSACSHLLHASCAMEWMLSGHDHCPYCRKEMMTPKEYREAAAALLSPVRMSEFEQYGASASTSSSPPSVTTADESDGEAAGGTSTSESVDTASAGPDESRV